MRPHVLAAAVLLSSSTWLAACGSDGTGNASSTGTPTTQATSGGSGAEGTAAAACTPADAPLCAPPRAIASEADFLKEQKALAWQPISSSTSGTLFVSADFVADADLVIDASTLALPPSCTSVADGGPLPLGCKARFREDAFPSTNDTARVAGVSCGVPRVQVRRALGELCSKLTIARGTVFRMRNVVLDDHPSGNVPSVDIVPACDVPCATGQARCAATQTCFALGYTACAYCEGKAVATCACTGACDARADGAICSYDSSPDTPVSGACTSGRCVAAK